MSNSTSDDAIIDQTPCVPAIAQAMADLTEVLATSPARTLDESLPSALGTLASALGLDWAILWYRPESEEILMSHTWTRYPGGPEPAPLARTPFVTAAIDGGSPSWFTRIDEVPDPNTRAALEGFAMASAAIVPLPVELGARGSRCALAVGSLTAERQWPPATIALARAAAFTCSLALARRDSQAALEHAMDEAGEPRAPTPAHSNVRAFEGPHLRSSARRDTEHLYRDAQEHVRTGAIVGRSPAIARVLEQVQQVAATDSTVLLLGETGTGKELIATQVHQLSARRARTMVRVNCAAIPSTLIESELFGREKGAFTGALARQIGRFETADRSTIFLDEIGDLSPDVQVKLLRVLEERRIERLGSPQSVPVDVRIIAATHRDLEHRMVDGAFREDLFYRLNVFPIRMPALRDRVDDIPLLVWRFVIEFSKSFGKRIDAISAETMETLQRHSWPGNIRELRNVIERAMIVATGPRLTIALPSSSVSAGPLPLRLEDVEREHIRSILERVRWRIRGTAGAAEQLGLRPTTLETRMAKLGLARPRAAC